ncbi:MAG TPA: protein-glutamate O-methyltransferase CheR [Bryobacteraceae bacterium]|nr:protein-glutamate O-methyltransferase CheR [Bryobacteraceae bacterium]
MKAGEFAKIRQLAYDTFGLDLRAGKETLVSARLGKHIRKSGCRSFDEYYRHVVEDSTGEALIHLIDALTTNHTSFFRESAHFDFLRKVLLPEWKNRAAIEIWSAACSSGEEPYSIAMCILEELGAVPPGKVHILATDISTRVLAAAAKGIYPAERFEAFSPVQLRGHWLRGERDFAGSYRAKKELRAMIEFRRLNLLEPGPRLGPFPLIFCRNVMIYFDKPTQRQVVERLAGSLEPGGYLLTGHAESLTGIDHGLHYVQPAVYRKGSSPEREKGKR